jgi:acetyltransferase-like isoleucine patch superfamily enzyme
MAVESYPLEGEYVSKKDEPKWFYGPTSHNIPGTHPHVDSLAVVGSPPEHFKMDAGPMYPPIIHPYAWIYKLATVDSGTERPTRIGAHTKLFSHAHVGHDAEVGKNCQIATGAIIGGHAEISDDVRIGLNATVLPYRKVGRHARVGAGAVVTHDVMPYQCVAGVPARHLKWLATGELLTELEIEGWDELGRLATETTCERCGAVLADDEQELCDLCALEAAREFASVL